MPTPGRGLVEPGHLDKVGIPVSYSAPVCWCHLVAGGSTWHLTAKADHIQNGRATLLPNKRGSSAKKTLTQAGDDMNAPCQEPKELSEK